MKMKLKDMLTDFYSDLPIKVKQGMLAVILDSVTCDELYLNEEYSYLRNSEVDSVYVSQFGKVVITIK